MKKPAYYLQEIKETFDSLSGEWKDLPFGQRLYRVISYADTLCCIDLIDIDDALRNIVRGRSFEVVDTDYSMIEASLTGIKIISAN